jgi:TrmH family RNA methyltransferase
LKVKFMFITSSKNPKIKHIRKLLDRKYRETYRQFFIEGLRIVGEALEQKNILEMLVIAPELLKSSYGLNLVALAREMNVEVLEVSREVFERISTKDGPQGIAAIGRQAWAAFDEVPSGSSELWVALDEVQDPGNLGTILRTCDSVGCKGVILLDNCVDPYDPGSLRASMGAIFSQVLVKASFDEFAEWKEKRGISFIGSSGAATQDYQGIKYPEPLVLLMGSEREGLKPNLLQVCDYVVRIPMVGKSDSLNLAIATAVLLYEIFNQKRNQPVVRENE